MMMFILYMGAIYVLGVVLCMFLKTLMDGWDIDGIVEWIKIWSGVFGAGRDILAYSGYWYGDVEEEIG